jgi:hypothetical protein
METFVFSKVHRQSILFEKNSSLTNISFVLNGIIPLPIILDKYQMTFVADCQI